jgi:inosine-uridine nucleoside N-ribohydrolase
MLGSVYLGYDGAPVPSRECNIVNDIPSAKKVFTSDWDMLVTPLDTCGVVKFGGSKYAKINTCKDPLVEAVMENYAYWVLRPGFKPHPKATFSSVFERTSVLFDTVAAYMTTSTDLLNIKTVGLRVTEDGYTVPDDNAKQVRCALSWKSLPQFEDWITDTLTGKEAKQPVIDYASRLKIVAKTAVRNHHGNTISVHP